MLYSMKECDFILSQLNHRELSEWEQGFVASIDAQRRVGKILTNKQVETLSKIWEKQS